MEEYSVVSSGISVWAFVIPILVIIFAVLGVLAAKLLRVAVRPNEVHIVQGRRNTISYGKGSNSGNSYWEFPEWFPFIGVQVVKLPLSVFDLELPGYEAYDVGKVPFVVDIKAFFRISDSNLAAERIEDMDELEKQLLAILQGAVRKVLANHEIEDIMKERSKFGMMFTAETKDNLAAWGVENVKDVELMDVRDSKDSKAVSNIMAKKDSLIEKESRVEVAENLRVAAQKEIETERDVNVSKEEAEQKVGERRAEKEQAIGVKNEMAQQEIKEQAKLTATKEMAVQQVNRVRGAEINKEVRVVEAEEKKQVDIVESEGEKRRTILVAEGNLESEQLRGRGIKAVGEAEAEAKRLNEMALVDPQIELAKEIGENVGYQTYLVGIRGVEANEQIGVEAAKALQAAGIKIIANTGSPVDGVNNVLDLFTSKGGTSLGSMAEGFAQTDIGSAIINKVTGVNPERLSTDKKPRGNGKSAD